MPSPTLIVNPKRGIPQGLEPRDLDRLCRYLQSKEDERTTFLKPLLEVLNLTTQFETSEGWVKVIDDLSFEAQKGKTLGIVGESGGGKTICALSLLRLVQNKARVSGQVLFENQNLLELSEAELQKVRGGKISFVFQEPKTSLNPVFSCGDHIAEALRLHHPELSRDEIKRRVLDMLIKVRIGDPEKCATDYPHQISGGMRQRVLLAMALIAQPQILIADEPTTSLDMTIQSQILELIQDLQANSELTVILISHDLGVIDQMCDDVIVMQTGKIVESGPQKKVFENPHHPYTKSLLTSYSSLVKPRPLVSI